MPEQPTQPTQPNPFDLTPPIKIIQEIIKYRYHNTQRLKAIKANNQSRAVSEANLASDAEERRTLILSSRDRREVVSFSDRDLLAYHSHWSTQNASIAEILLRSYRHSESGYPSTEHAIIAFHNQTPIATLILNVTASLIHPRFPTVDYRRVSADEYRLLANLTNTAQTPDYYNNLVTKLAKN